MARKPRFVLPGYPQHVIQRGNNRQIVFARHADYCRYREMLGEACDRSGCRLHAYVFMTNHVHLLMTPDSAEGIGMAMQSLGRRYVRYFNDYYGRTGTLYEGRYKATLIDTDAYLLACYRYIELNPVRAGMVSHPSAYRWSSYRSNALGEADALVTPHDGYLQLGRSASQRRRAYRALHERALESGVVEAIREATNKAWVLGSERFRRDVETLLRRQLAPKSRGGDRKSATFRARGKINRV